MSELSIHDSCSVDLLIERSTASCTMLTSLQEWDGEWAQNSDETFVK